MLEHVNLTVGERWEDDMTKFWYEVRKLGRDDVMELEQIRKGKVISDNVDKVDNVDIEEVEKIKKGKVISGNLDNVDIVEVG